jgi:hypothetical protein
MRTPAERRFEEIKYLNVHPQLEAPPPRVNSERRKKNLKKKRPSYDSILSELNELKEYGWRDPYKELPALRTLVEILICDEHSCDVSLAYLAPEGWVCCDSKMNETGLPHNPQIREWRHIQLPRRDGKQ